MQKTGVSKQPSSRDHFTITLIQVGTFGIAMSLLTVTFSIIHYSQPNYQWWWSTLQGSETVGRQHERHLSCKIAPTMLLKTHP